MKNKLNLTRDSIRRIVLEELIKSYSLNEKIEQFPTSSDTSLGALRGDEEEDSLFPGEETDEMMRFYGQGGGFDLRDAPPYIGGGKFGKQLDMFGRNNWRSCQPTIPQLKWLIESKGIKHVIRLSGSDESAPDGRSPDNTRIVSHDDEEVFCSAAIGPGSFEFINAHKGYRPGRGYTSTISEVLPILAKGNCFIHCRNGADRTGYLVAAFMKEYMGDTDLEFLWDYTIQFNSWGGAGGSVCSSGSNLGYAKYLDGFYSLNRWCASRSGDTPSTRSTCYLCRKGLDVLGFDETERDIPLSESG